MKKIKKINLVNKKVILRLDLNVPLKDGIITNDNRIKASLPTIEYILKNKAQLIILSHLGRPTEGEFETKFSLQPVRDYLVKQLKINIRLAKQIEDAKFKDNENCLMLENVRFFQGEKQNSAKLGKRLASLGDIFVMDAFAVVHRAQASTCAIMDNITICCSGFLLEKEIESLDKVMLNPKKPLISIVGGSKVSTKLPILENLLKISDYLIAGGGIANTLMLAQGKKLGKSLVEPDLVEKAKELLKTGKIPQILDVVTAKKFTEDASYKIKLANKIDEEEMVLDIGPQTVLSYDRIIQKAETILLNGPLGVFEFDNFANGTKDLLNSIAQSKAFCVAGGGDTIAALEKFNKIKNIDYISTAGGAFLEYIQGKKLPVIELLRSKM